MARRGSFSSIVDTVIKEYARTKRETLKQQQQRDKELLRMQREAARLKVADEKKAKQAHYESRIREVQEKNSQLNTRFDELTNILANASRVDPTIPFKSLYTRERFVSSLLPPELNYSPQPPRLETFTQSVARPHPVISFLFPSTNVDYDKALKRARESYQEAVKKYRHQIASRNAKIHEHQHRYEIKAQERNKSAKEFEKAYKSGEREAIIAYSTLVLERSVYPWGFPQNFRVTYRPAPQELVIEYQLPHFNITPTMREYHYIKTRDTIQEKLLKPAEVKELYQDIVSAICLRTIYEVLRADQGNHLQVVVFNGYVEAIDPATGHDIAPHLISVRTSNEKFMRLKLARVHQRKCLQQLGALISPHPDELLPVSPLVTS